MHPFGRGIYETWKRVGIGRAQLRHLPPIEDLAGQLMTLLGKLIKRTCTGRPGPGLGSRSARQPELAEQYVAELLGASWIERFAGKRLYLRFKRHRSLAELIGELGKHAAID